MKRSCGKQWDNNRIFRFVRAAAPQGFLANSPYLALPESHDLIILEENFALNVDRLNHGFRRHR